MSKSWRLIEPKSDLVYRVRGLPAECNEETLKAGINDAFSLREENSPVRVHSLAATTSPVSEKTATISSPALSRRLTAPSEEWIFEVPSQSLTSCLEDYSQARVIIDTHFQGFTTLYAPSAEEHVVDCVAISGLNFHAFNSFKSRETNHMWLRDDLPKDLSGARILLYGYDVKISDQDSSQDLEGLASTFRRSLMTLGHGGKDKSKPLIFIAHSLGGLLLKEALIHMSRDPDDRAQTCIQSTFAMLFFACPNQGMDVASLIPLCQGEANQAFVHSLRQLSERLRQICRDFPKAFAFVDSRIISFYETRQSPTAVKGIDGAWSLTGPHAILVSEASATHGRPGENEAHDIQAINSTHSEMVKFGIGDPRYQLVLGFLKDFIAAAPAIIEARSLQSNNPCDDNIMQAQTRIDNVHPSGELTKWLAPRSYECSHYEDDLHAALSSRHPNTCQWIYRKSVFKQWLLAGKGTQPAFLWLHAIPGAGKTVLSSYVIDNLLSESKLDTSRNERETFYFFFNNADSEKNTPLAAARALVHQLLRSAKARHKQRLIEELETVKRDSGQSRALNFRTLWPFFASQCKHLTRPTVVLDALDECEQIGVFLSDLHALVEHGSVNVLATSRREAEIIQSLDSVQDLAMGPDEVHDDINAYLEYEVSRSSKLSNAFIRSRIMRILNIRSKGMFLWVVLMLEELESKQTVMEIEDVLANPLPRDLNEVYERILLRLNRNLKTSQQRLCRNVLKWITLAKRPLRISEIEDALQLEYSMETHDILLIDPTYTLQEIQMVCGSLVTLRGQSIHLIHISTRDFLLTRPDSTQPTAHFFINPGSDCLQLTRTCILYISETSDSERHVVAQHGPKDAERSRPFLHYACMNWLTHITPSDCKEIPALESTLISFLTTRKCLVWIELCLLLEPEFVSQLTMDVQSLIYWLSSDPVRAFEGDFQQGIALLRYWAEACLGLLTEYGWELQDQPYEIHSIDPSCIFGASRFRIEETLSKDAIYDRHIFLEEDNHTKLQAHTTRYLGSRTLQRHTSPEPYYALFYLHRGNKAFVSVDKNAGKTPRIQCQEASSGRKLPPVCDSEFGEDLLNPLTVCAAAISKDGNLVGIFYRFKHQNIYFAVWRIHEGLDFDQASQKPWAHKIISRFGTDLELVTPIQSIVFDDNRDRVYCPLGCFNIKNGILEKSFDEHRTDWMDTGQYCWDISFSHDGSTMFRNRDDSRASIEVLRNSDLWLPIYSGLDVRLMALSRNGRFMVLQESDLVSDVRSYHWILVNLENHQSEMLATFEGSIHNSLDEAAFYDDDQLIIGIVYLFPRQSCDIEDADPYLYVFKRLGSEYQLSARRAMKGPLAGHYFDEQSQHIYVVSENRTWTRLDTGSERLRDIDPPLESSTSSQQVCQLSWDGRWLAIFRSETEHFSIAMISLEDFSTRQEQHVNDLNLDSSENLPLIKFSPRLDRVLVGNKILHLESSQVKSYVLPFAPLFHVRKGTADSEDNVKFSFCGNFVAVMPQDVFDTEAQLQVYEFTEHDSWKICYHLDLEDDRPFSKITLDMHPSVPEIVIGHWPSVLLSDGPKPPVIQAHFVDLRAQPPKAFTSLTISRRVNDPSFDTMNSPSLETSYMYTALRYSPCGTYVFSISNRTGIIKEEIPGRAYSIIPPIPKVVAAVSPPGIPSSLSTALHHATGCDFPPVAQYRDDSKKLTMIPKYLAKADAVFVLGNGLNPSISVLFFRNDAPPEMRLLRIRLNDYLENTDLYVSIGVISPSAATVA